MRKKHIEKNRLTAHRLQITEKQKVKSKELKVKKEKNEIARSLCSLTSTVSTFPSVARNNNFGTGFTYRLPISAIFFAAILIFTGCARQVYQGEEDILYLMNGEEVVGTVMNYKKGNISVKRGKSVRKIPGDSVASIEFSQVREGDKWKTVNDIKDKILLNALKIDVSNYKNAGYVNLLVSKNITFKEDRSYIIKIRKIRKIMAERGENAANNCIYYLSSTENAHLDFARTVRADGTITHIMDNAIENASVYTSYPDYDRLRSIKFAIPEAGIGNILDYQITIKGKSTRGNPFLLDDILGDKDPTIYQNIELISAQGLKFYFGSAQPDTDWVKNDNHCYIWELKNDNGFVPEINMPPLYDVRKRAFASPIWGINDLINLFKIKFKNYKSIADSIINEKQDTIDILYNFVRENIKYVPVGPQAVSFRPYLPIQVIKRGYGNSFDKTFLFYALLRAENIPARAVLVKSKEKGKPFLKYPVFSQFDGMIVTLKGKWYEPTLNIREPGVISGKYQGTMGMDLSGKEISVPFPELKNMKTSLKRKIVIMKNGNALVSENIQWKGLNGEKLRRWKELLPEQIKINIEAYINAVHSGALLKNYHLSNLKNMSKPPTLSITYKIKEFSPPYGKFMIFHLPGLKYNADVISSEKRNFPIFYPTQRYDDKHIELIIPKKYKIRYLMKSLDVSAPGFDFILKIRSKGSKISFEAKTIRKGTVIAQKEYSEYKSVLERVASLNDKWIVLEKR